MIQWVINGVKVDIVNNGIENIYPVELIDNIRIASELDVTALKLNAVTGRGAKKILLTYICFFNIINLKSC